MSKSLVIAVYLGPRAQTFKSFIDSAQDACMIQTLRAGSKKDFGRILSEHPRAVTIIESEKEAKIQRITNEFPSAVVVGVVDSRKRARRLLKTGIFSIILSSDPVWRVVKAIRNACEFSRARETNNRLHKTIESSRRMVTAAAGAAGIVHDAKNCLCAVKNILLLERQKSGSGSKKDGLHHALSAIEKLIEDLRAVLSPETIYQLQKPVAVAVDQIACQVTNLLAYSFRLAGVRLERYLDVQTPPILCRASSIAAVLLELLTNSLKACSRGDSVMLRIVKNKNGVLVEVSDTASRVRQKRCTEGAQSWYPQQELSGPDSGLGLALVKRIASTYGSQLEIDRRPGSGIVFRLRLPADGPLSTVPRDIQ